MNVLSRLWRDNVGFVVTSELVLISTTLVLGMVVGAQTVRDSVLEEVGDVAAAIGSLSQDYSFAGARGHYSEVHGSIFQDVEDPADCNNGGITQSGLFRTTGFTRFGSFGDNCVHVGIPPNLVE